MIVSDNGLPSFSATGVVTVVVRKANNAPTLAPIANRTINQGALLLVTNTASDSDVPANLLTFSLGAGAPFNATIDTRSGLFRWRPLGAQAPSTNLISVLVTDNGLPPLSAAQSFTVTVLAVPNEFTLRFGSTNVLAGESNSVPVELLGTLDLTNITAVLQTPADRLTNLTLVPVSPDTIGTVLQPFGANQYSVSLTLDPARSPAGNHALAQLGFLAVAQPRSAVVPLTVSQLAGLVSDGQSVANPAAISGRVIVVANEPVVGSGVGAGGAHLVTLYGQPWHSYQLQYSTNGVNWIDLNRVPLTNRAHVFTGSSGAAAGPVFYRTREFVASPPILDVDSLANGNLNLVLYGVPGSNYQLQTATSLTGTVMWHPFLNYSQTNSFRFAPNPVSPTNPPVFYRIQATGP